MSINTNARGLGVGLAELDRIESMIRRLSLANNRTTNNEREQNYE